MCRPGMAKLNFVQWTHVRALPCSRSGDHPSAFEKNSQFDLSQKQHLSKESFNLHWIPWICLLENNLSIYKPILLWLQMVMVKKLSQKLFEEDLKCFVWNKMNVLLIVKAYWHITEKLCPHGSVEISENSYDETFNLPDRGFNQNAERNQICLTIN